MTPERQELEALFAIGEQSAAELTSQHKPVCTVINESLSDGTTRVRLSPEFRGRLRHGTKLYAALEQAPQPAQQAAWERVDYAVHLMHCNIGEHEGYCKYGDDDKCPALAHAELRARYAPQPAQHPGGVS